MKRGKTKGKMEKKNTKGKMKANKSLNTEKTAVEEKNDAWMREESLYFNQIRHLEEQLHRGQLKRDGLRAQNQELKLKLSRMEEDTRDIHQYLLEAPGRCQKEKEEVLGWLEQHKLEEKRAAEADELQMSLENQELQREVDTVTSEIEQQASQMEQLNSQVEELTLQLEELKEQVKEEDLDAMKKQHEAEVQQLELEHKRLLEEEEAKAYIQFQQRIRDVVQQRRTEHEDRIRKARDLLCIHDRESALIEKLKKDLEKLHQENRSGKAFNHSLTMEVTRLRKEVKAQTRRVQRLQDEVKVSASASQSLQDEVKVRREKLASTQKLQRQHTATAAHLVTQLEEERNRTRKLEKVMKTAAVKLTTILKDSSKGPDTQLKMEKVLTILENARPQEGETTDPGPHTTDPGPHTTDPGPHTTDGDAARAQTENFDLDPLFLLARCRPGDLSYVPRNTQLPIIPGASDHTSGTRPDQNRNFHRRQTLAEEVASFADPVFRSTERLRYFMRKFINE